MAHDVIVLGLGAMGSAAAFHLASRGARVLGIEQFTSPHDQGSSHGGSRMIRQAYFESPDYIPLVLRAYELWRKLESDSGTPLLHETGGLILGPPNGVLVAGSTTAARIHNIPFEIFEGPAIPRRFPAVVPLPGDVAVLEPHAGYLLPEPCIRAHLQLAARAGADLHFEEPVLDWRATDSHVTVRTGKNTYEANHLVITAGPWANQTLQNLFPIRVTRQLMAWIQPRGGIAPFTPDKFPVFLCEDPDGHFPAYGFPAIDGPAGGLKAAVHGSTQQCTPDTIDRSIHPAELQSLVAAVSRRIPALRGPILSNHVLGAQTCMYSVTPDEHFILGPHPLHPRCTVACGFSGHGFKFSSIIGEILADLATTRATPHPINLFSPTRFR